MRIISLAKKFVRAFRTAWNATMAPSQTVHARRVDTSSTFAASVAGGRRDRVVERLSFLDGEVEVERSVQEIILHDDGSLDKRAWHQPVLRCHDGYAVQSQLEIFQCPRCLAAVTAQSTFVCFLSAVRLCVACREVIDHHGQVIAVSKDLVPSASSLPTRLNKLFDY